MGAFDDLNVLFCYHGHSLHYDAPVLGNRTVVCGPFVETREVSEHRRYVRCEPVAVLAEIVAALDPTWRPDVVVVRLDAGMSVRVDVEGLRCSLVLLLGDTHHMAQPIRTLIDYVGTLRYDYAFTYNNLRHAHFLSDAGVERLRWAPGFIVTPHDMDFADRRSAGVCAIGNLLETHVYRRRLVDAMFEAGLPITAARMDARQAAETYATRTVSFNCSLNGDLNMRALEILSSGGFLLTDRLSPLAGLDRLFVEGHDYVAYDNRADLVEKCRHYLARPQDALKIARCGRQAYWSKLAPAVLHPQVWDLVFNGQEAELLQIGHDPRSGRAGDPPGLGRRIAIYEDVQERHHRQSECRVLALPGVPRLCLEDLCDLPRLQLSMIGTAEGLDEGLFVTPPAQVGLEALERKDWSLILLSSEEFRVGRFPDGAPLLICDGDMSPGVLANSAGRLLRSEGYANVGVFDAMASVADPSSVMSENRSLFFDEASTLLEAGQSFTGAVRDVGVGPGENCAWGAFMAIVTADQPGTVFIEGASDAATWLALSRQTLSSEGVAQAETRIAMRYHRVRFENTGPGQSVCRIHSSFAA